MNLPGSITPRQKAFTLIEVLVTIGVIGVLIAILIPVLAGGRSTAQRTASLANLRTIGQLVHAYTEQYDETYPWATGGINGCGIKMQFLPVWQMERLWPVAMHEVMPPKELRPLTLSPGARREGPQQACGHPPSYTYSQSFLARPDTWSGRSAADESLLRGVTIGMVTHPSSKALMWEWELPYKSEEPRKDGPDLAEPTPMLFVDGHARARTPSKATEAVPNPFPDAFRPTARLHNTPDGVRGRDY
jgi:prepilin-type N-terminal cleavage/methylation domain-containing protein